MNFLSKLIHNKHSNSQISHSTNNKEPSVSKVDVKSVQLPHTLEYLIIKKCFEYPLNTNKWCLSLNLICKRFNTYLSQSLFTNYSFCNLSSARVYKTDWNSITRHLSNPYCAFRSIKFLETTLNIFTEIPLNLFECTFLNLESLDIQIGIEKLLLPESLQDRLKIIIPTIKDLRIQQVGDDPSYVDLTSILSCQSFRDKTDLRSFVINNTTLFGNNISTSQLENILQNNTGLQVLEIPLYEYQVPLFRQVVFLQLYSLNLHFMDINVMVEVISSLGKLKQLKSLTLTFGPFPLPSYNLELREFDLVNEVLYENYLRALPALVHFDYIFPVSQNILQCLNKIETLQSIHIDCREEITQFQKSVESIDFYDITSIQLKKFLKMVHPGLLILKFPQHGYAISNSIDEISDYIGSNKSLIFLGLNEPEIAGPKRLFIALSKCDTLRCVTFKQMSRTNLSSLLSLATSSKSLSTIYFLSKQFSPPTTIQTRFSKAPNRFFKLKSFTMYESLFFSLPQH